MKRFLCLWFPNWPVQRLLDARPDLRGRTIAIYHERRGLKVVASSRASIPPGTPVAEVSGAQLIEYDAFEDRCALEELAHECDAFSPLVGLEEADPPDSLLLDVTGIAPLFGDEAALAEQIAKTFARRGFNLRLAIADTLGAAWALSHYACEQLCINLPGAAREGIAELPIESLRLAPQALPLLHELGVHQVKQLLALPESSLARRFGPELVARIQQALGVKPELILPHRPPPQIVVARAFEYPLEQGEAIEQVLAQMVDEIALELDRRQLGVLKLECTLDCEEESKPVEARLQIGLYQASAAPRHLMELIHMQLEQLALPGPVTQIQILVLLTARIGARQQKFFDDTQKQDRQLALLVDRLSSRIGRRSITRPELVPDAQPEFAYRCKPLTGRKSPVSPPPVKKAKKKTIKTIREDPKPSPPRPLLVEPRPIPLSVLAVAPEGEPQQLELHGRAQRVARCWGPERIQTGWWRNKYIRRDYYGVQTDDGRAYWIFRSGGKWFLQGEF